MTSRFTLGSAEIPQNAIVKFNFVHDGLNTAELMFLQWHTNQSACSMNVYDVSVQCGNRSITHCMGNSGPTTITSGCLKTNSDFCVESLCLDLIDASSCHTHSVNSICPTPTMSPSFSATDTQYSQSYTPLTSQSTATIVSSPAIVTSTTRYSSTSMTRDSSVDFSSSSTDLISSSPSPTSLYCLPDPPWPLTPAGYNASLNSTCQYGLFNGKFYYLFFMNNLH